MFTRTCGVLENSKEVIPYGEMMGTVLPSGGRKPCRVPQITQHRQPLSENQQGVVQHVGWARAESGTQLAPVAKSVERGSQHSGIPERGSCYDRQVKGGDGNTGDLGI